MLTVQHSPPPSPRATTSIQTFAAEADRERLTPAALAGVRRLADAWKLTGDEAAALLGVSNSTWDRIRAGTWRNVLSQDQLTRVSALVGAFKGLNLLFADGMADRWPRLRNSGPLFDNLSPVERMMEGGIPAMIEIRRYVDGLRGGL
ncbi:antitoxin Xre-like helix-turn-helix domain-containing protein [Roseinatronobacter monicus]|uniref:antitoxin Xre-like helix-turn-helix domain-containing protein n=1 Tax=Roseinatronobacter monicus TaxID=393481 RepID=UPI003F323444